MTWNDWLRQRHVARIVGFKPLENVTVVGAYGQPQGEQVGLGVVYSTNNRSRTACVALALYEGKKGTTIGFDFMRHYTGAPTADLISCQRSLRKLRDQLGKWAPPMEGWDA